MQAIIMKRLGYIDAVRGLGVILMVLGHICHWRFIERAIYGFHMPLFFFLSGLLFTVPTWAKLAKRLKRYLVPYLVFGIGYLLLHWALNGFDMRLLYALFWYNSENLPYESALWFLTAIMVSHLVYSLLAIGIKNRYILFVISMLLSLIVTIVTDIFGNVLPYSIQPGIAGIFFFACGHFISDKIKGKNVTNLWSIISMICIMLSVSLFELLPRYNMRLGMAGLIPINQLLAVIVVICIVLLFKKYKRFEKILIRYGANSIIYLGFNHIAIKISSRFAGMIFSNKILYYLFTTITAFIILALITAIINYARAKILNRHKVAKTPR